MSIVNKIIDLENNITFNEMVFFIVDIEGAPDRFKEFSGSDVISVNTIKKYGPEFYKKHYLRGKKINDLLNDGK